MALVKTLLMAVVVTLATNCSTSKKSMDSEAASEDKTVSSTSDSNTSEEAKMIEAGFMKGTIVASTKENDCPYVIQVENKDTYLLDPINMDASYQKDGMKVWFTFSGLRMMNRCDKANPINIIEIEKRSE